MKYIKLFENFLLKEAANTNLEMKSIFKNLVNELRKMGLKVKFEYKKFDGDFSKFIPSKNLYEQGDDVYFVMNDDESRNISLDSSQMKLFFNYNIDKEKASSYVQNVKNLIDSKYSSQLQAEVFEGHQVGLIIKPKNTKNKSAVEHSMDANKFMGLKRTPATDGISYLVGSGWEYVSDSIEKTREFELIKIDDNSKMVEINKGLVSELSKSNKRDKLVNIAKEFASKNGYKYNAISNSFE
jgi:hypothetical protein